MIISIITPTYNSSNTINDCVSSIKSQEGCELEHIVIDGLSTDCTLEVLKGNMLDNTKVVSENDTGIYDAMNKGIKLSNGSIIGILNSDDKYSNNDVLLAVKNAFSDPTVDIVFGNIKIVNNNETLRVWKPGQFKKGSFMRGWHPPHPAFFVRRNVYEKYDCFNTTFNLAADFEFMLRVLEKNGLKSFYIDKFIVDMGFGGATTGSIKNIIRGNLECMKAFKINGFKVPILYPIIRLIPKIKQFIAR